MQTTRGASLSDATNSADATGSPQGQGRSRRVAVLLAVAATVLAIDVISKVIVVAELSDREPIRLLWGFTTLRVTRNSGAAFSIGTGATFIFSFIAVGVIVAILRFARRLYSLPWAITLGLLLGGATGNLVDRLLRSPGPFRGHVVDWIEWPHWPVFNLADSSIVCGGAIAVLLAFRGIQLDGTRQAEVPQAPEAPEAAKAPEVADVTDVTKAPETPEVAEVAENDTSPSDGKP